MAQSSLGYIDEEEDRAAALPLDTEERASANLKSPDFEKPAAPQEPAAPRFATPMARALAGFAVAPDSSAPAGSPIQEDLAQTQSRTQTAFQQTSNPAQSQQSGAAEQTDSPSPDATAPEQPVQAPRLKGADADTDQALQHLGEQPEPILPPRAGYEDAWLKATDERQRQNDHQQAGIHAFLKSRGVETETLPDGSQTIATHPDGQPAWKPATSSPFQDQETGQWVVRQRDDHGNLRDVSAHEVQGAVHTDAKTGDQYVYDANRQPVKIGVDQGVVAARAMATTRSFLYARENQAAAQISDLNASLAPVRDRFHEMQGMAATESDSLGGKSQSIKQVENTIASLQSSASTDPAVLDKLKASIEARDRFYQDNPEYAQIKAALAGGKEQMRQIDADRRRDRDTRIQLALGNTSAAVHSTLLDTRATTGQPSVPGDADPAEVARNAAVAAGANGSTQSSALVGALRQMQANGAQTVGGRPIGEAIQAAMNPPVKPKEPAPRPGGTLYALDDKGGLQFDHEKPADALKQALEDGKADPEWAKAHMDEFQEVQKKYADLEKSAGSAQVVKALLKGGGRGAAFLAGAHPGAIGGAALLSESGPGAIIGGAVGGLITGSIATWGYDKLLAKLGDYSAAVKSMNDAAELHPVANQAGELVAFASSAPKSILNLTKAARLAKAGAVAEGLTEAAGNAAARKVVGTQLVSGAVGGAAFEGILRPAFDAARNKVADQLGIEHGAVQAPDTESMLTNIALGVLTASHGMKFQKFTPEQISGVLARGDIRENAGIPLDKKSTPEAITAAYQTHGITLALEDAAQLAAPMYPQEIGLRAALKRQQAHLEAKGAFKGFTGAEQAQGPGHLAAVGEIDGDSSGPAVDLTTPPEQRQARAFTDNLRKSDILQRKAEALPADHPLEDRRQLTERQQASQDALDSAHKAAVEEVPEVARKALAAVMGAKPEAMQAHFDEQPDAVFQAAHIGQQLRDLYTTPEQRARVDSIVARVGEHGPTARFIADQHVGMRAARDLTAIAALREVPPERVAGLQRLGLVEMENGQPVVTHDALHLLPKGLTARLVGAHDAYRVKSLLGEKMQGAAAMVRAGHGQLEQALHAKALATRAPAEMATHRVRVEFTNKAGKSGETTFDVKARSEEEATANAIARVEKSGVKVDHAEVTTKEKDQARQKAKAAADPMAPNVATPAKLSDFTPAEQQFANLVGNEYRRNQKYLSALGISKVELVRNSADRSGLAVSSEGVLHLDAAQLKKQADTFSRQGVKAKDWARTALQEEAWHAIQFRAAEQAGVDWKTHYGELHDALSPEMLTHAREVYTDFDSLPKHAQAAEVERMILQNKWNGTITEKFVASIERILAYLKGLKIESPLLRESIARVEAVRDEALKQAEASERHPHPSEAADSADTPETSGATPEVAGPHQPESSTSETPESQPSPKKKAGTPEAESSQASPEPATPAAEAQAWMADKNEELGFGDNDDSLAAAKTKTPAQKEAERLAKLRETRAGFAAETAPAPKMVEYDNLPEETKADIEHWLSEHNAGAKEAGADETTVRDNLRSVADQPSLRVSEMPVGDITGFKRKPSGPALAKYVDMFRAGSKPPPILVDGHEFVDGGHRLAAAIKAGVARIPVVDVGPMLRMDWQKWTANAPMRWEEPRSAAPAPDPHILTKPEGRSAINAYHHLARTTGFPAVSIADLADQSGVPLDRLKQQLLRSQKAGSVVLSTGDWSLASDKQRAGVIEDKGQKMLQVRFLNESGDLAAARAKEQDRLGFYSHLSRVAEAKLPNRGTPEQIMATLKGNGVKESEMQWIGLPQYLEGKQSVFKDDLRQFIAENNVQMKEVVKRDGVEPLTPRETGRLRNLEEYDGDTPMSNRDRAWMEEAQAREAAEEDGRSAGPTKFSQYALPGGTSYKEKLLTLPVADPTKALRKESEEITRRLNAGDVPADELTPMRRRMDAIRAEIREATGSVVGDTAFRGTHWDEPNVLAHTREADHTDTEGNKVRLIEEIQSDWHQKGRKEGYAAKELSDDERRALERQINNESEGSPRQAELIAKLNDQGVPDAPFKKTWPEVAFKRSLRSAVDDGMDKVAWVTGDIAADRFDLSKQVDSIVAIKRGDKFTIIARKDGITEPVTRQEDLTADKLPDLIGKDLAQKIASQEEGRHSYAGEDLKVGGAGMRGFYGNPDPGRLDRIRELEAKLSDQKVQGADRKAAKSELDELKKRELGIVGLFADSYVKPWGGKVETSDLAVDSADEVYDGGDGTFWTRKGDLGPFDTKAEAIKALGGTKVHSVTITPAMRDSVQNEGQALFAAKAVAAAHTKVAQTLKPLIDEAKTAGAKHEISQDFDYTGTHANIQGLQAQTHIRLPFERPIPKDESRAARKAREAAVKQDLVAARPVVEAGGSKARLAADLAKVNASTDAKLKAKFAPIYQYALDNFDRLNRMLAPHIKLANENYDQLKAAGVDVGKRAEYVHRVTTPPEDPDAPHLAFEMGNGNGSGNARGMLKGRSFDTMGDAIKAGYDPGTYGIHEADGRMVQNSTRIIGDKAFLDKMKQVKAPTDGKPIISQLVKRRLANGETDLKVPDGYSTVNAMGRPLVIHKMFAPLFRDLYGTSAIRNFAAGRALLKLAAAGKHGTLVFDTFHVGRLLYKMAAGGGGSPIVIRDGKPAFNYHAGLSMLEYSDADLATAVKQGEVTPEEAAFAKKHRAALDELVKAGLNVGKVADNLMEQVKRHVPVITTMNDWIFGKLSRGAMVQTALKFYERNLTRPGMSREQAARRTATEMNEYFGNLQNQGIFKSKTLQDIARLVFLAPNWTESQARYEARAYGQLGASAVDAARGKGLRAGNATRAMATGFVALLAANQVANYLSRGQSTFENEEDGHKLDAWVPGGKRGFWFNPFEIAGEYAHATMKYTAQHENPVDVATHILSNKLSPLGRGVKEAGTGRDAMGRHFLSDTDRFRSAVVDTLPSPLPLGGFFEKDPRAPIGYRVTRANGGILPSMEKQAMQSLGAKVTAAQSPRTAMFAIAQPFKKEGVYADSAGEYSALRQSLDQDEPDAVKTELRWLLDRGKDTKTIAAALGVHANGITPEKFTGSKEGEAAMLKALTPQQRKTYDLAQKEHIENAKKFLAIARSPEGQQIIAEARKKAAQKKQQPVLAN